MTTVAALYVDPKGPYYGMPDVDCWGEDRDARLYEGPWPVVAHPPCGRWCAMARVNEKRWGAKVGEDGGCFAAALAAVRQFGGVLEHPAKSLAWAAHDLIPPRKNETGWVAERSGEWVCEVWQSAYGHLATKATWLFYVGPQPPELNWARVRGTHQIGGGINTGFRQLPRCPDGLTHLTPPAFAVALVQLARTST